VRPVNGIKGISMKFEAGVIACFLIVSVIPQCGRRIKDNAGAKNAPVSVQKSSTFVPPQDSVISAQQMAAWFVCNPALDSLSDIFTTSLSGNNPPALTDSMQKNFLHEQDRICIKKGLPGGNEEYRWVLEHLGSSKNKALYDSTQSLFPQKK
jgi:hypothetical protein